MDAHERWQPVARVLFKEKANREPLLYSGADGSWDAPAVNTKARLLQLSKLKTLSLDLVESYDLLEMTCETCGTGLGYPRERGYGYYGPTHCQECNDKSKAESGRKRAAEEAQRKADEERFRWMLARASEEDQAAARRLLSNTGWLERLLPKVSE